MAVAIPVAVAADGQRLHLWAGGRAWARPAGQVAADAARGRGERESGEGGGGRGEGGGCCIAVPQPNPTDPPT